MSSCVRLAAMMPAMRAAPSTSPFLALPLRTIASVFGCIRTRPSAIATRSVVALADTSTMRASPLAFRCDSLLGRRVTALPCRRKCGFAGEQGTCRRRDVVLPHQTFADQEGRNPDLGEASEIVRRLYATFADQHRARRHVWRQPLAGRQRGLKRLEISVVDADQPRFQGKCAVKLAAVVDLDQRVHPVGER